MAKKQIGFEQPFQLLNKLLRRGAYFLLEPM